MKIRKTKGQTEGKQVGRKKIKKSKTSQWYIQMFKDQFSQQTKYSASKLQSFGDICLLKKKNHLTERKKCKSQNCFFRNFLHFFCRFWPRSMVTKPVLDSERERESIHQDLCRHWVLEELWLHKSLFWAPQHYSFPAPSSAETCDVRPGSSAFSPTSTHGLVYLCSEHSGGVLRLHSFFLKFKCAGDSNQLLLNSIEVFMFV